MNTSEPSPAYPGAGVFGRPSETPIRGLLRSISLGAVYFIGASIAVVWAVMTIMGGLNPDVGRQADLACSQGGTVPVHLSDYIVVCAPPAGR